MRWGVLLLALLVLAGPTMDLDGPVRIYRWHDACRSDIPSIVRDDLITRELELTYGEGDDHAEGLSMLGTDRVLVVYDSPAAARLTDDGRVIADVLLLPERKPE